MDKLKQVFENISKIPDWLVPRMSFNKIRDNLSRDISDLKVGQSLKYISYNISMNLDPSRKKVIASINNKNKLCNSSNDARNWILDTLALKFDKLTNTNKSNDKNFVADYFDHLDKHGLK